MNYYPGTPPAPGSPQWPSPHQPSPPAPQGMPSYGPPPQGPPPQPYLGGSPAPRRKRTGLITGVIAGVVVLALVIVGAVRLQTLLSDRFAELVEAHSENGYQWTAIERDLPRNHVFTLDIDFDPAAKARDLQMSEREFGDYAWSVYTDPGLTRRAGSVKEFTTNQVSIVGNDPKDGAVALTDEVLASQIGPLTPVRDGELDNSWGLHDEYYLLQRVDEFGNELSKPIVTPFTVQHELPAPRTVFRYDQEGNLEVSWQPVDGATEYLIVKTEISDVVDPEATARAVTVIGTTPETTWSTVNAVNSSDAGTVERQNVGLELFLVPAERVEDNSDLAAFTGSDFEYGVIASDGASFSPYAGADATRFAAELPHTFAADPFGANSLTAFTDLTQAPTAIRYLTIDGAIRDGVGYLDPASITEASISGYFNAFVGVRSTRLAQMVSFGVTGDPVVAVQEYNERALRESPHTGLTDPEEVEPEDLNDSELPEPQPTPTPAPSDIGPEDSYIPAGSPDMGYPVYGSNNFVRHLAASMIAGEETIDITAYADQPGAQSIEDAVTEARSQNQYVIGMYSYSYSFRGDSTYVKITYLDSPENRANIQAQVKVKVDEVIGSIVDPSMSDSAKVTAINDYIVDIGEYDMAAFDVLAAGGDFRDYWYTQDVYGIFLNGLGVCASYSRTFDVLADAAGLESVYVTGDVYSGGAHAWNKVKVDGQWRAVDVTWNDTPQGNAYLMISDAQFTDSASRMEGFDWMNDLLVDAYAAN